MLDRKINYSPQALENRRTYAREYYHKHKNDLNYMVRVRTYDSTRCKTPERKERNRLWKALHPEYNRECYAKDPERFREYARKSRSKRPRIPRGKPGSVRYEARLAGYRSGFERSFATNLQLRMIEFDYEPIKIPYTLSCEYNPDFYIRSGNFYVETKGYLTAPERRKYIEVRKQNPNIDLRFVFMSADSKMSGGKQTHAEWATRHKFKWAEGKVPDEWLEEQHES